MIGQPRKTQPIEVSIRKRDPDPGRLTEGPRALDAPRGPLGHVPTHAQTNQLRLASPVDLPLFPLDAAQATTNPAVQTPQDPGAFDVPKVSNPAPEVAGHFVHALLQANPPLAPR